MCYWPGKFLTSVGQTDFRFCFSLVTVGMLSNKACKNNEALGERHLTVDAEAMTLSFCCCPFCIAHLPKEVKATCLCGKWDVAMPSFNILYGSLPHIHNMYSFGVLEWMVVSLGFPWWQCNQTERWRGMNSHESRRCPKARVDIPCVVSWKSFWSSKHQGGLEPWWVCQKEKSET